MLLGDTGPVSLGHGHLRIAEYSARWAAVIRAAGAEARAVLGADGSRASASAGGASPGERRRGQRRLGAREASQFTRNCSGEADRAAHREDALKPVAAYPRDRAIAPAQGCAFEKVTGKARYAGDMADSRHAPCADSQAARARRDPERGRLRSAAETGGRHACREGRRSDCRAPRAPDVGRAGARV